MYGKKHNKQAQEADGTESKMNAIESLLRNTAEQLNESYQSLSTRIDSATLLRYSAASIVLLWGISGIYIVDEGNRGVVTRQGA